MKSGRFEMRVSPETLARVDVARGELSRAAWIVQAIERALVGTAPPTGQAVGVVEHEVQVVRRPAVTQRLEAQSREHLPTCRCPVCSPPKT